MFDIDSIIREVIQGTLSFDRAFIRLRRGVRFRIKNWQELPVRLSKEARINREQGWKSTFDSLIHRYRFQDVF